MKLSFSRRQNKKSALTRKLIVIGVMAAFVLALVVPNIAPARAATLSEQIRALQAQVNQQRSEAANLHSKADGYKGKVAELQAQMESIQTQIILNQAKYDKTTLDIDKAKEDLAKQKAILDENIRTIYQQGSISSLEILASSDNFSDFVNQQEYAQKVKDKVASSLEKIKQLKTELDRQQAQLASILSDQKAQRSQLADAQTQASQLLSLAEQDASAADKKVQETNSRLNALAAQQAAALRGSGGTVVGSGGSGGYPWPHVCEYSNGAYYGNEFSCGDDGMGYILRQCVSWVAWRRGNMGFSIPYYWGSAGSWYANHVDWSIRTPQRGDIIAWAYSSSMPYGHVAIVENVSGNTVTYSQYNYNYLGTSNGWGMYSQVSAPISSLYRPGVSGFIR